MSQLRENLNPGLEAERQHLLHVHETTSSVKIVVDAPSSDEAETVGDKRPPVCGVSAGNDSDPPIENENPDGNESFNAEKCTNRNQGVIKELDNAKGKGIQVPGHYRKRKKSTHNGDGNYIPPYKKNRFFRRQTSVLPSKFLLGGNIRDPLNLASLSDARISAELNRVTPQSSPLPVQGEVPVFIPKNPHDPLGLTTRTPENAEDMIAGIGKNNCRKHRHRKRQGRKRTDSECSIGTEFTENGDEEDQIKIKQVITSEPDIPSKISLEESKKVDVHVPGESNKRKRSISEPSIAIDVTEPIAAAVVSEKKTVAVTIKEKPTAHAVVEESTISSSKVNVTPETQPTTSSKNKEIQVQKEPQIKPDTPGKNIFPSNKNKGSNQVTTIEETESSENNSSNKNYCETVYPTSSSDYIPMSSFYAPSPFAFDSTEYYLDASPYESPTFPHHLAYTPTHELQPFSPPPMPEVPHFQQRMQMFAARPQQLSLQRAVFQRPYIKKRMKHKGDPIVSPVIPQPGSRRRPHHHQNHHPGNNKKPGEKPSNGHGLAVATTSSKSSESTSVVNNKDVPDGTTVKDNNKYKLKDQVFQFGNYSHYYGYRTPDQSDARLWVMKKSNFEGKDVLDIGCNSGHVTLSIARDFEPRRVQGIDIDFSLVTAARKNVKNYMTRDPDNKNIVFPRSLPLIYGAIQPFQPLPAPGEQTPKHFPYNVSFAHENYVLASDALLEMVKPEYDVILCLSVTKWIHLNFGDDGMKRFFKRAFLHLRSGGVFILEPQPWSSYSKKKKITEKVYQVYNSITFFPDQFEDFLLKEVGFAKVESLGTPAHHSKGFQRPLIMFTKDNSVSSSSATTIPTATETVSSISEPDKDESVSQSQGTDETTASGKK